tara:strand:- start:5213 stop:5362 length:150 start_codon:yes stop_codon:yes gene_type:complete
MDVENNLQDLKKQLKQAEVVYYKILGAVEALEAIQSEVEKKPSKDEKTK